MVSAVITVVEMFIISFSEMVGTIPKTAESEYPKVMSAGIKVSQKVGFFNLIFILSFIVFSPRIIL